MQWNLLLLVLLGGYYFSILNPKTAHSANRLARDRLLFHSALTGIGLALVSYFAIRWVIAPWLPSLTVWWNERFPQPLSGTAAGALALGLFFGLLLRLLVNHSTRFADFWRGRHLKKWVTTQGSFLEKLLYERADIGGPVQVNLENRKVYIGQVDYVPAEFESASTYLELTLYASGYREDKDLSLTITNRYVDLFNDLADEVDRLRIKVRRLDRLENRSWFSWGAQKYDRHQKIREEYQEKNSRYKDILAQLRVEIPFNRIISVMPYDAWVYHQMDGLRKSEKAKDQE